MVNANPKQAKEITFKSNVKTKYLPSIGRTVFFVLINLIPPMSCLKDNEKALSTA